MNRPTTPTVTPTARRTILAAAFLIGLAIALAPRTATVQAQTAPAAPSAPTAPATPATPSKPTEPSKTITISSGPGAGAKIEVTEADGAKADAGTDAGSAPAAEPRKRGAGGHNVTFGKGGHVTVNGLGTDREFDSFGEFVHDEPAIAMMVFGIVTVVFLSPILAIALILWYRFRKARMVNETMVKLAEKGIVPSQETLDALASGARGSRVTFVRDAAPATASAAETAPTPARTTVVIGGRSRWSDLRKGVIMGGVGLALMFYSMLADSEPNAIGLILFFVGVGFVVLWWFEERQLSAGQAARGAGTPAGAPPPSP